MSSSVVPIQILLGGRGKIQCCLPPLPWDLGSPLVRESFLSHIHTVQEPGPPGVEVFANSPMLHHGETDSQCTRSQHHFAVQKGDRVRFQWPFDLAAWVMLQTSSSWATAFPGCIVYGPLSKYKMLRAGGIRSPLHLLIVPLVKNPHGIVTLEKTKCQWMRRK